MSSTERSRSARGEVGLVGAVAGAVLVTGALATRVSAHNLALVAGVVLVALPAAVLYACVKALAPPLMPGTQRQGWWLMTASALAWLGAEVVGLVQVVVNGRRPPGSAADVIESVTVVLAAAGLLLMPDDISLDDRIAAAIDAVTVALSVFFFGWALFGGSVERHAHHSARLLVRPVSSLTVAPLIVYAVVWTVNRITTSRRRVLATTVAAFALIVTANLAAPTNSMLVSGASWWGLASLAGYGLIAVTLYSVVRGAKADNRSGLPQIVSLMPLICVEIGVVTGCIILLHRTPSVAIYLTGALLASAILSRQVLADRQLRGLRRDLQSRVDQKVAELAERERFYTAVVQHSTDAIAALDERGRFLAVSESIADAVGVARADLVGQPATILLAPTEKRRVIGEVVALMAADTGSARTLEFRLVHRDGLLRVVEATFSNQLADPAIRAIIVNARDVTERVQLQRQLTQQAWFDELTGLGNRALLLQALQIALEGAEAVGLLFLDVDDFKLVNDSMGHAAGDDLLRGVAARVMSATSSAETVARLGGDEFAVVVPGGVDTAMVRARAILGAFQAPVPVGDGSRHLGISIGVAGAVPGTAPEDLLRDADLAMYSAKGAGKGRVAAFTPDLLSRNTRRAEVAEDLADAVEAGQLVLVYQPVWSMRTRELRGFEALLRWRHPAHGDVAPELIIELAERSDLILELGDWIVMQACQDLVRFSDRLGGGLVMAVNVTERQLYAGQMKNTVNRALAASGIDPARLVLEISEHALLPDGPGPAALLGLQEIGALLAIDDFGAGYSSFARLQQLPIDVVKLDRSIVAGLPAARDAAVVSTLVALAHHLGATTVAEGIESSAQRQAVEATGCDFCQGFGLCPPMEREALIEHLSETPGGALEIA